MKYILLEETTSTNDYIKRFSGSGEDVIVCAKRQTAGRGTKGRAFLSEEGGVYFSALTFYDRLPACEAFRIMMHAAVAVCRTAERFSAEPSVKWPNDVLIGERKLCGILIENTLSGGYVRESVVGIGLNVVNDLAALGDRAVGLGEFCDAGAEEVRGVLVEEYAKASSAEEYLRYVRFLGSPVWVAEGEEEYEAVAREILPDGRLLIEHNGTRRALSSAEISIRIGGRQNGI